MKNVDLVKKTISTKDLSLEFKGWLRLHPFATTINKNSIMFLVPKVVIVDFEDGMLALTHADVFLQDK